MNNYKCIVLLLSFVIFGIGFLSVAHGDSKVQIKYPIPDLGNCKNKDICKKYCDISVNYLDCTNFGLKKSLITNEVANRSIKYIDILKGLGPGGCKGETACKNYCNKRENQNICVNFGKSVGLLASDKIRDIQDRLKSESPQAQGCIRSFMDNVTERVNAGDYKNANDIPTMAKDCLPAGVKIPVGGGLTIEMLNKMREFYGNNLPTKDQEILKELQVQLKGKIPQGTSLPKNPLNLDDIKSLNTKMQEEMSKIPAETLEYIREQQKQQEQNEIVPQPKIQGGGQGGGMGL